MKLSEYFLLITICVFPSLAWVCYFTQLKGLHTEFSHMISLLHYDYRHESRWNLVRSRLIDLTGGGIMFDSSQSTERSSRLQQNCTHTYTPIPTLMVFCGFLITHTFSDLEKLPWVPSHTHAYTHTHTHFTEIKPSSKVQNHLYFSQVYHFS